MQVIITSSLQDCFEVFCLHSASYQHTIDHRFVYEFVADSPPEGSQHKEFIFGQRQDAAPISENCIPVLVKEFRAYFDGMESTCLAIFHLQISCIRIPEIYSKLHHGPCMQILFTVIHQGYKVTIVRSKKILTHEWYHTAGMSACVDSILYTFPPNQQSWGIRLLLLKFLGMSQKLSVWGNLNTCPACPENAAGMCILTWELQSRHAWRRRNCYRPCGECLQIKLEENTLE